MQTKTFNSQTSTLLSHLRKTGSVSSLEAYDMGMRSWTRRIRDLREAGHNIISEPKTHPTTKQRYVRYHLIEKAQPRVAFAVTNLAA